MLLRSRKPPVAAATTQLTGTVPDLVTQMNASSMSQRRAWSRDAEVVRGLRQNGYKFNVLMRIVPVSVASVPAQRQPRRQTAISRASRRLDVAQPSLHQRVTARRDSAILERYRNGQNQSQIAAELDVSTATVGHTLSKHLSEDEYAALSREHRKADAQRRVERRKLGLAEAVRSDLAENGDATVSELVERTGLSYNVVSTAVNMLIGAGQASTYSDPKTGMVVGIKSDD